MSPDFGQMGRAVVDGSGATLVGALFARQLCLLEKASEARREVGSHIVTREAAVLVRWSPSSTRVLAACALSVCLGNAVGCGDHLTPPDSPLPEVIGVEPAWSPAGG